MRIQIIAGEDLFVRELNALAAYRWRAPVRHAKRAEVALPSAALLH